MRVARRVLDEVIGLFVADWSQTIGIIVLLGAGYGASRLSSSPVVAFTVALLLGIHLVYTTRDEGRRRLRARAATPAAPSRDSAG